MKRHTILYRSTLLACAALQATAVLAAPTLQDAELDQLVEAYFDANLALNPLFATQIGDNRFNDRYPNDIGPKWREQALASERQYLAALAKIDAERLSPQARLTYDVFKSRRQLAIESFDFPQQLLPIDQFNNPAGDFAVLGSGSGAHPFATPKDYEDFIHRMDGMRVWIDQAIANMREGVKHDVTQPRPVIEKVLPQLKTLATARVEDSIFFQPLNELPDGIDAATRQRLATDYRTAIERTLTSYRLLYDYMSSEYLPAARTSVGWSQLPGGKDWYAFLVAVYTTTRMSPDEIHELGLREVARIEGEMNAVRGQVGFKGDLRTFFRFLKDDPRFYFDNAADVLSGYRDLKLRINALLPKMFADFPKADYEIRAVEAFRAQSAAGAFYERPSADGSRPGIFYVNTFDLKGQPKYGMETLSLHEASPGHHFQVTIQQELTGLPRVRRFDFYTAYGEGWALYCESIGKELGLFTDPYQYYGRLNDEMLRAMRLVVDTGLHSRGWSREQGIRFMLDHSSLAESDVTAEVERYIAWPGQALGYKIGQLRISAMRAKAEKELGPKFDVKAFHSVILRDGALPMDVLELKVDRWINETKGSP